MTGFNKHEFFIDTDTGMKLNIVAKIPKDNRLNKAVLLVHGSGVGPIFWDMPIRDYSIMNYLVNRGIDTYAVECRGYGQSTKPNGLEVTAGSIAEDIESVLKTIKERSGVDKVSLAGHSSGGTVLLMAGGQYPELMDRMVIIGTPYKKINPDFMKYAQMVIDMAKEPGKDYVPNLHYKDIEHRLDSHDEDVLDWYKRIVKDKYSHIPGGIFPDIVENPGIKTVPTISVPVLIINGSNEYVIDLEDALAMFKDFKASDKSFIIQPNAYHLMFLEKIGHVGLQRSIFFWVTKN